MKGKLEKERLSSSLGQISSDDGVRDGLHKNYGENTEPDNLLTPPKSNNKTKVFNMGY